MRRNNFYIIYFLLFISGCLLSQSPQKIRFAKSSTLIYFFQVGSKSDTILKGKGDRFTLLVPDTLKENILINIENAKMESTNDSSVILKYVPGLKYESFYLRKESPGNKPSYEFKAFVNGTSTLQREKIIVQFIDRRNNKMIFENKFYYLD